MLINFYNLENTTQILISFLKFLKCSLESRLVSLNSFAPLTFKLVGVFKCACKTKA